MSWRGAAAILLLGLLAASCGQVAREGPVEIRYWTGWTGHELAVQRSLIRVFNQTHPHIRVKILCVAGSYQKVPIAIAGGDTPDVCSAVWSDQLYGYASRGALEPLDSIQNPGRSMTNGCPSAPHAAIRGARWPQRHRQRSSSSTTRRSSRVRARPRSLSDAERARDRGPKTRARQTGQLRALRAAPGRLSSGLCVRRAVSMPHRRTHRRRPGNVAALRWLQSWFRSTTCANGVFRGRIRERGA